MPENKIVLHTETVIDSAHKLDSYEGPCCRIHGHSWLLKVWIKGTPEDQDKVGIIFDFGKVKEVKEKLDHKYINDVINFNPTAENLVMFIYDLLKRDYPKLEFCIRLYETAVGKETWAQYGDFEWK